MLVNLPYSLISRSAINLRVQVRNAKDNLDIENAQVSYLIPSTGESGNLTTDAEGTAKVPCSHSLPLTLYLVATAEGYEVEQHNLTHISFRP